MYLGEVGGTMVFYKVALYEKQSGIKMFFSIEGWKHVDVEKPLSLEPFFSGDLLIF